MCVLCVKKPPKTFVYINYSVCIDVGATNKQTNKQTLFRGRKHFSKSDIVKEDNEVKKQPTTGVLCVILDTGSENAI